MLNKIHRNIRLGAVAAALAFAAMSPAAHANSLITWGTATNETGNSSDILTSGTFLESAFLDADSPINGASDTVNGVVFAGEYGSSTPGTYDFTGSNISISSLQSGSSSEVYAPGGYNANYATLVEYAGSTSTSYPAPTITLGGLTIGQEYEVQIFEPWWNGNYPTSYSDGTDTSAALTTGCNPSTRGAVCGTPTTAQYITGTFTATGTTESIYTSNSTDTYEIFSALQVRDITTGPVSGVPEPGTLGVLSVGLLGLGLVRRFIGRRAG
jgi:hypothetical protein